MKLTYDVQSLEEVYLATIEDNLRSVDRILAQLGIADIPLEQFQGILFQASQSLTQRWRTGRKTVRTQIARMLIPDYPRDVLELSLAVDAIINLLDDLLDELLAEEQKAAYILEFVRVLALFNHLHVPPEYQERIADYFNKCIGIVVAEIVYREKMKATDDFGDRLSYALQCYDAKSLDMDVFMELPLVELLESAQMVDDLVAFTRIHRAVALIRKDFHDLSHDKENHTETPIVLLSYEGREALGRYMEAMIAHYAARNQKPQGAGDALFSRIAANIHELIAQELAAARADLAVLREGEDARAAG